MAVKPRSLFEVVAAVGVCQIRRIRDDGHIALILDMGVDIVEESLPDQLFVMEGLEGAEKPQTDSVGADDMGVLVVF